MKGNDMAKKALSDLAIDTLTTLTDESLDAAIESGNKETISKLVRVKDELESLGNNGAVDKSEKKTTTRNGGRSRRRGGLPEKSDKEEVVSAEQ